MSAPVPQGGEMAAGEVSRIKFSRPKGNMSRRELISKMIPKQCYVPYTVASACVGCDICRICAGACPTLAIGEKDGLPFIDLSACTGCGYCTTVCPYDALKYPGCEAESMDAEMQRLLGGAGKQASQRVTFVCANSVAPEQAALPGGGDVIKVPCLNVLSPWVLLRAFDLGASGVTVVCDRSKCGLDADCSQWTGWVEFVRDLLDVLGLGSQRLRCSQEGMALLEGLPSGNATGIVPVPETNTGNRALKDLILSLADRVGVGSTGEISGKAVPFGWVTVEADACTACGICARECPTEALVIAAEQGEYRIRFTHGICVGCGQCAEACPEKCLACARVLKLAELGSTSRVIGGGGFAKCRVCGLPFAPKSMIEKLRERLAASGVQTGHLDVCPNCRVGVARPSSNTGGHE